MEDRPMNALNRIALSTLMLALPLLAGPASADTWDWATGPSLSDKGEEGEDARDWSIDVVPYLWVVSLSGDIQLPAAGTIPVGATFGDLASNLDGAFTAFLDLRFRRWHLISDNSWVRLRIDQKLPGAPVSAFSMTPSVAFGTVAVDYELPLSTDFIVDVYLGARWWHVTTDAQLLTGAGFFAGGVTETWADAIVGSRIRYSITESWRIVVQGDVGAGGSGIDWSAMAGVTYLFNDYLGVTMAYRVLGVDYRSGLFLYDMRQNGLLLGVNLMY